MEFKKEHTVGLVKFVAYRNVHTNIIKEWKRDDGAGAMIDRDGEKWSMFGTEGFFTHHVLVDLKQVAP